MYLGCNTIRFLFPEPHFASPHSRSLGYGTYLIGGTRGATSLGKIAYGRSFQVFPILFLPDFPDTIIFPHLEKRFVKHSAQGYAATRGRPSGWMKQKEARPLVVAAWDAWAAKRGLNSADATGRDALQFYYELQDVGSPLLKFISREREKWQVIHDWLVSQRRIGL
jgi:hypothetical protein